jgi:phosphate transport system permease protein
MWATALTLILIVLLLNLIGRVVARFGAVRS